MKFKLNDKVKLIKTEVNRTVPDGVAGVVLCPNVWTYGPDNKPYIEVEFPRKAGGTSTGLYKEDEIAPYQETVIATEDELRVHVEIHVQDLKQQIEEWKSKYETCRLARDGMIEANKRSQALNDEQHRKIKTLEGKLHSIHALTRS